MKNAARIINGFVVCISKIQHNDEGYEVNYNGQTSHVSNFYRRIRLEGLLYYDVERDLCFLLRSAVIHVQCRLQLVFTNSSIVGPVPLLKYSSMLSSCTLSSLDGYSSVRP